MHHYRPLWAVCCMHQSPFQPRPWWQLKQRLMEASGCLGRNFDETRQRLRCASSSTCSLPILLLFSLLLLQLVAITAHATQNSILCPKSVACRCRCCCCCSLNLRSLCKMKCPMRTAMHLVANSVGYALQTHKITVIVVASASARCCRTSHTVQLARLSLSIHQGSSGYGRSLGI